MPVLSRFARYFAFACAVTASFAASGQSSCSSDGRPPPVALLERFISADCASCWADAKAPRAGRGEVAIDWIVPSAKGDDAPLSAAASRDAPSRLEGLQRSSPPQADTVRHPIGKGRGTLRVAHGLPFNGYIGASIEWRTRSPGPWTAWLMLLETVPAGTEGTAVERHLVRNTLQLAWEGSRSLSKKERARLFESRPLSIPEGANPKRLHVVGWVEDAQGRVVGTAKSACAAG
ncbi:hypothetical protein [Caenimonas aquaedulcis]|uniref:DUF1223 domain-containing protein n=1 Tax=Caenimonas aquaedulcis TaxID=2793270 RepID=A0A931MJJ6_9BURK|nr:hypothetical protein [Caenimonas aquaedulcis]MBG9390365.1 hypothetical protein [Caenimonas aquaedulcis]